MRLVLFAMLAWAWCVAPVCAKSVCSPAVLSSIEIKEETTGFSIDLEYPVLCQSVAAQTLRDHVARSLAEFKQDPPVLDSRGYPYKHEMIVDYAVWSAGQGRFASVKLQVMVYTGGAHPNHWPETWVFDMTDGRAVSLADLFVDEQEALVAIAPMVQDVLRNSLGDMAVSSMLESGTVPSSGNYDDFILNQEGVAFFFAPYQVAPYAAGQQVVTIPWARLGGMLSTEMERVLKPAAQ